MSRHSTLFPVNSLHVSDTECDKLIHDARNIEHKKKWKNSLELDRPEVTIWRLHIACCLPKATNTNSRNTYNIVAFPLQQWLYKRASLLRILLTLFICPILFPLPGNIL
jgi:hypothetical protein